MILILLLFRISFCGTLNVPDQTKQPYKFPLFKTQLGIGILSKYCPLGVSRYLYEKSNIDYYYFLQNAYYGDNNELFYLIYVEIQFDNRLYIIHLQYNLEGKWIECKFPLQIREIEGIWIKTIIYYLDTGEFIVEQLWGSDKRIRFTFTYTNLPNIDLTAISGGSYSDINPITKQNISLNQFPGQLSAAYLEKTEFLYPWQGLTDFKASTAFILQKEPIVLTESISNQQYTISTMTQNYYKVSFWAKTETKFDSNFDQILHIIRIVANRYTQDFMATGSNSFVLDYIFNEQKQQWILRINFYSYIIPIIVVSIPDDSLIIYTDEISIESYSLINTWHFIQIEYQPNNINFYFLNQELQFQINKKYENVYQFSQIYYRLIFGGTILDKNTLSRSFALISFYDYIYPEFICHYSCQSCFGPLFNHCLSCQQNSNRVFNPIENTCQCQLWYVEVSESNCNLVQNTQFTIILEDEEEGQELYCNFGEFEYDGNCYKCPSAGQENLVVCSACLMRPTDWIYKNPQCSDVYYQHDNNPNYQYVKLQTDQKISNQYYIFQNDELQPCYGCKICYDELDSTCRLSLYTHLNKETYIQCLQGYYFNNGKCVQQNQVIKLLSASCMKNCVKCNQELCLICSDQSNYFLNYMGQCQLCAIKNCKYCFQYNSLNLNENSIARDRFQNTMASDDFEIGCAQCEFGYIYSFSTKQCFFAYYDNGCQNYINKNEQLECFSTQFDKLITPYQQIDNCQKNLQHCDQCIYSNFGILVCIKCSYGYFINKHNGLCYRCSDFVSKEAQHCQLVDSTKSFLKLSLFGFLQYQTQTLNDLNTIFKDFDIVDIVECKANYFVDKINNQCVNSCTYCDNCALINSQQQCVKCVTSTNYTSSFYSQKQGNCYTCPYLCKFCLQIDADLIEKNNPYFIIKEENINQAMKCLINFNKSFTYIDYKSGLIRPFNNVTNKRQSFSAYNNVFIKQFTPYDDLIKKSVNRIYQTVQTMFDIELSYINNYYSLTSSIVIIQNSYSFGEEIINIFNITEVRISKIIFKKETHYFNIWSYYGVKVQVQNCTITKMILKNLFIINQPLLINFTLFNIYDINFTESEIIQINNHLKSSILIVQNFNFNNANFTNSIFINHSLSQYDRVYISDLNFINCYFDQSLWFIQKATVTINTVNIRQIKFINCTFKDSLIFQIAESTQSFFITDFQVINCSFYNSSLVKGFQNLRMTQIFLSNSSVKNSNLFIYSFSKSEQTVIITHLICQQLFFNVSTILFVENKLELTQTEIIIRDWKLENLNLLDFQAYISQSTIFIISNANIQIKDITINNSIYFTFLITQNCQAVVLSNIQITQKKEVSFNQDIIDNNIHSRYLMYFSQFSSLSISQFKIINWIQTSDSLLIIRSDLYDSKFIEISQLEIENYSSYNVLNQINSAIFIQIDTQAIININKSNFIRCNFWYRSPNTDIMQAALIRIKSPKSQVTLDHIFVNLANVYNSSESIIFVDATNITFLNSQVIDINTEEINYQLNSRCGFAVFLAEQIKIINTYLSNIYSILYGVFYNQLKLQGDLYALNCIFNNSVVTNNNSYLTQLGGLFSVDGKLSTLDLNFINITAINVYTEEKAAFLYLIPSSISNQIHMYNISLINVISKDNLFGQFQFPYNSQDNKIVIEKIIINNRQDSSLIIRQIEKQQNLQTESNYEGILSTAFSSISINDFIYEGYLTQPIFKLDVNGRLKITNLKFVSIQISNEIQFFVNIEIQSVDLVIIENLFFEKIYFQEHLEYLFKLNQSSANNAIISQSIHFREIICSQCTNGLVTFINSQNQQSQIIITEYLFYQNNCGLRSCLLLQNLYGKIEKSYFINNIAQENGIIFGIQSNLYLKNSMLTNNKLEGVAGAIYLNESILDAQNSQIVNNSAKIGGAIYSDHSNLTFNIQQRRNILFYENKAQEGFNNIREQSVFLKLNMFGLSIKNKRLIQNDQTFDSPSYVINHKQMRTNNTFIQVATGQKLNEYKEFDNTLMKYSNYTISIQLEQYTQLGEKIIDNQGDICMISQYQVNSDLNLSYFEIISQPNIEILQYLKFDNIEKSYKLDNFSFYLEPYSNQSIYLLILAKCQRMPQNYNFIFKIKTLPCQIGEYYNQEQCLKCDSDKGYYSVEKNSIECQRLDPTKMKAVTSYQIELLKGFWRHSYYSYYIEQCENFNNCLGGWNVNYESCDIGYIGAICNECDIYNVRGYSSYIKSLSGLCKKKEYQRDILVITVILMLFIFFITYLISFLKNEMHILYKKLVYTTIHHKILFKCEIDQLNTTLKQFINFMQILYPILPPLIFNANFPAFAWPIGKSSKTLLFLINYVADDLDIEIHYLKMVWAVIIPIIQISIIIFAYALIKRIIINSNVQVIFIQSSCIFLLFYSMPNIMEELIVVISRRTIVNLDWIGANLSYMYYTKEHQIWIWQFIFPSIFLIFLVIPILTFVLIFKNHKKHTHDVSSGIYGYFCSDFKLQFYYWELLTLQMKLTIIFILCFLDNDKMILKNLIVIIILFGYYGSISILKPFSKANLNRLEKSGIILCCLLIQLNVLRVASSKYSFQEVQYLTEISMLFIVLFIHLYMLKQIFQRFINKNQKTFDRIRIFINSKFPNLIHKSSFFAKHLKIRSELRINIFNKFQLMKPILRRLKVNNNRSVRNATNIHEELVTNILRSDHKQLIPQYSIQNSIIY